MEGVQARIITGSHRYQRQIVVGIHDRDPQWHDLYRLDSRGRDTPALSMAAVFSPITT
jgi:hypothetical protein